MARLAKRISRREFGLTALAFSLAGAPVLPARAGEEEAVRLTVVARDGTETRLTDADLDRLPRTSFDTSTPWTAGVQHFEGVLLRDVLLAAGVDPAAAGGRIEAMAHNDYTVVIPLSDAAEWDVLVARRMGGKVLTLRDKGPLWIVYPRDGHAALRRAHYFHRWVWQLRQLKLL